MNNQSLASYLQEIKQVVAEESECPHNIVINTCEFVRDKSYNLVFKTVCYDCKEEL